MASQLSDLLTRSGLPELRYPGDYTLSFTTHGIRVPTAEELNTSWTAALDMARELGMPMQEIVTLIFLSKTLLINHLKRYPDEAPASTMTAESIAELRSEVATMRKKFKADKAKEAEQPSAFPEVEA